MASLLSWNYSLGSFATSGSKIFFGSDGRVVVYDISDWQQPEQEWLSEVLAQSSWAIQDIILADDLAFVEVLRSIHIFDLSIPAEPVLASTIANADYLTGHENLHYLLFSTGPQELATIQIIDLTNPISPQELSAAEWGLAVPHRVIVIRGTIYAIQDGYVEIISLPDSAAVIPHTIIRLPTDLNSQISVVDDYAYVFAQSGVWILDVSEPISPKEVSYYSSTWGADHMNVVSGWLFLGWQVCGFESTDGGEVSGGCGQGIEIVDVSDVTNPRYVGVVRLAVPSSLSEKSVPPNKDNFDVNFGYDKKIQNR